MNSKNFFQRFINKIIPFAGKASSAKQKAAIAEKSLAEHVTMPGYPSHWSRRRCNKAAARKTGPSKWYAYSMVRLPKLGKSIH